jgi:hypothetical protein
MTHYEVLGVDRAATHATIRSAYRRLARRHHPDLGGDAHAFAALAEAWRVLSSQELRDRYDAGLDGDEDDWGEAVGFDAPVPPPGRRVADDPPEHRAAPEQPPSASASEPEPGRASADPRPEAPARVDPFRSGPRALPTVAFLLDGAREPRTTGWRGYVAAGLVWAAVLTCTTVGEAHPATFSDNAWFGQTLYALVMGGALVGAELARGNPPLAVHRTLLVLAWCSLGVYGLIAAGYVLNGLAFGPDGLARAGFVDVAFGAGTVLCVRAEVRALRARHWTRALARARRWHGEAMAWNALLEAVENVPSTRLTRLGPEQPGGPSWAAVDGRGEPLLWAPEHAPTSWVRALRAAGVDVHDPREDVTS